MYRKNHWKKYKLTDLGKSQFFNIFIFETVNFRVFCQKCRGKWEKV